MRYLRFLFQRFTKRTGVKRGALFVLVFAVAATILTYNLVPESVTLEVGQASPQYIGAPRQVEDRYTTQLLRQEASYSVAEVFEQNPNVLLQVLREQQDILEIFAGIAVMDIPETEKRALVIESLTYELTDSAIEAGLTVDEELLPQLQTELSLALEPVYRLGIKLDGLESARNAAISTLNSSGLRASYRTLMIELARVTMRHNMTPNETATRRLRQEAEARVSPVIVQKTQKIIGQGEIATEREITLLQDLGLLREGLDWLIISGSLLFAFLCLLVPALYVLFLSPTVYNSDSRANLLGTVLIGGMVFVWAGSLVSGYIIPVAAVGILLTALISPWLGLISGVSMAMFAGGLVGFEFRFLIVAILGAAVGVYAVSHKGNRTGLVSAGIIVGGINILGVIAFGILLGSTARELLRDSILGLGGGMTASILAIGSLPFLENAFGMTSDVKLMELANPHQDLLKRLLIEAPGTYHHSIIVANLAEAACEEVGAHALRARVGAYYHDIGKISRPYFFIENQTMMENPHDNYPPNLSALIITSHVKDGVKLAEQHRLPQVIVDIIREHHGTSSVQYFYNKALEEGEAKVEDFSYAGPRPRSKESAIVMLADVVEASVRAISSPTPDKIEARVRAMIKDKLHEGQLDECDLSLRELHEIGTAFVQHLSGIFHNRIEYPQRQGGQ